MLVHQAGKVIVYFQVRLPGDGGRLFRVRFEVVYA